jgi:uncharacterized protein Usg
MTHSPPPSSPAKTSHTMERLLRDYRLTTAEILYRFPDHPSLLQTYVWQDYDISPAFPELKKFLDFWEREIEGKLHQVRVESCELIKPSNFTPVSSEIIIH